MYLIKPLQVLAYYSGESSLLVLSLMFSNSVCSVCLFLFSCVRSVFGVLVHFLFFSFPWHWSVGATVAAVYSFIVKPVHAVVVMPVSKPELRVTRYLGKRTYLCALSFMYRGDSRHLMSDVYIDCSRHVAVFIMQLFDVLYVVILCTPCCLTILLDLLCEINKTLLG